MSKARHFEEFSYLFGSNAPYIEELYEKYMESPQNVDETWRKFFNQFITDPDNGRRYIPSWSRISPKIILGAEITEKKPAPLQETTAEADFLRAAFLINNYRQKGHFLAKLDPLGLEKSYVSFSDGLAIEDVGFSEKDLDREVKVDNQFAGVDKIKLRDLVALLKKTYAGNVGFEFNHVERKQTQDWLYDQVESSNVAPQISHENKKKILKDLVAVEGFEQYIHKKFPGAKRFSVEGTDNSIIALERIIEFSNELGTQEFVLGMAHRGRLNTLTKVMGKPYSAIFSEFKGEAALPDNIKAAGDVKYHMGYSSDKLNNASQSYHLSLMPNPSHLEAVNPLVAGKVRAKQDQIGDIERRKVLGILMHGDAAFCGQGVVAESLAMSGLDAYDTGGIIHIVVNNQIGFTANAKDSRPGRYATEVAKMVGAPIIHINGDDAEAIVHASKLAAIYRNKFGKDIVLDIIGYRKYGHNEGDEPMFTQPQMYRVIKDKPTPAQVYADKIIAEGVISASDFDKMKDEFKNYLDKEFDASATHKPQAQWLQGLWSKQKSSSNSKLSDVATGVAEATLKNIGEQICKQPAGFNLNPKIQRFLETRAQDLAKGMVDWASAEALAYCSLLLEGSNVRITGQDAGRGTFSHRHSVFHDQENGSKYLPFNNISKTQAKYEVADSHLSEYAVLGFEYGYSHVDPNNLVIWEAQFGDFANGAQIIFDQFISSAETKWLRMSGLVVLLPHGYEGQGPEHSSARLERFLQLCAEDNMQVAYPTTPASIFHLMRRQIKRDFRKPLIIMSPKSLLRHKLVVSKISDIAQGTSFKPVLDEVDNINPAQVKKLILCTGKVYYDLYEKRAEKNINDAALVRIEQLYPRPTKEITAILKEYKGAEITWCQEEPQNMGAWNFMESYLNELLSEIGHKHNKVNYVGRKKAASPAVGNVKKHNQEQAGLVNLALGIKE